MGIKEKLTSFFFLDDENYNNEATESLNEKPNLGMNKQDRPPSFQSGANHKSQSGGLNVVSMSKEQNVAKPKITLVEPRLYSEVKDVADILLSNQSVILNFRRMEKDQARQTLDFLMGVSYAVKGDIERIGEQIFICTPQNVELDGKELNAMKGNEL